MTLSGALIAFFSGMAAVAAAQSFHRWIRKMRAARRDLLVDWEPL